VKIDFHRQQQIKTYNPDSRDSVFVHIKFVRLLQYARISWKSGVIKHVVVW